MSRTAFSIYGRLRRLTIESSWRDATAIRGIWALAGGRMLEMSNLLHREVSRTDSGECSAGLLYLTSAVLLREVPDPCNFVRLLQSACAMET